MNVRVYGYKTDLQLSVLQKLQNICGQEEKQYHKNNFYSLPPMICTAVLSELTLAISDGGIEPVIAILIKTVFGRFTLLSFNTANV